VIRIPLVTALSEELMFRSVLLAVLLTIVSARWAVVWSSVAFGLWHVLGTLGDLGGNAATDSLGAVERVGSVVAVVVATTTAGVIFAWTRLRSESLVAPWMIHVAFNGATFAAGLAVAT
jgi:membrane protease YdiL (CAAX protease family)